MKDTITIQRKDLQMLSEALKKAKEIIQGFKVEEKNNAPKLSPQKRRMMKYQKILASDKRVKKSDIIK